MYQEERLTEIYRLLEEKKTLKNQDIMNTFHVSRDTARRDILELVNRHLAVRTHGGLTIHTLHDIGGYSIRQEDHKEIKRMIAQKAASYITVHKICFFDASTTIETLCPYVPKTVEAYTNGINNIPLFGCPVHVLGGVYHKENHYSYGSETLHELDSICFDMAYMAAAAIHEDGIYVEEHADALIKNKVASRSAFTCIVADHTKFNKRSSFKAFDFNQINMLITDGPIPPEILKQIRESGCMVDIVKKEG